MAPAETEELAVAWKQMTLHIFLAGELGGAGGERRQILRPESPPAADREPEARE